MKKMKSRLTIAIGFAVLTITAGAAEQESALHNELVGQWPMLDKYCSKCHNYDDFSGGLALEDFSPDDVTNNPVVFEEVLRKLKISAMPPRKQPQPTAEERKNFVATLEQTLDAAVVENPYAGTTSIHRLNRAEYTNSIRDLLGVDIDLTELLPSDGGDHGFDNIGELLRSSPMLLDRYMTVGLRVADLALGNSEAALSVTNYDIPFDTTQEKHLAGFPIGTRGGVQATHYFPADGEYVFSARPLQGVAEGYFGIEGHDRPHEFLVYIDGKKEGNHKGWWENGKPKFNYNFLSGEHQGELTEWYNSGNMFRHFNYQMGYEEGAEKMWWENGEIRANYVVKTGKKYGLIGMKICVNPYDSILLKK